MGDYGPPMCMYCRHYRRDVPLTCSAYPERIPDPILQSRVDHRKPYRGDHGVTFQADPKQESPDAYLATLFGA
jgi:hypothetical protein